MPKTTIKLKLSIENNTQGMTNSSEFILDLDGIKSMTELYEKLLQPLSSLSDRTAFRFAREVLEPSNSIQ